MRDGESEGIESTRSRGASDSQAAPILPTVGAEPGSARDVDTGYLVLRLLVGALAEGSEGALRRLHQWNELARDHPPEHAPLAGEHRLRWMLLGLLVETQAGARSQLAELRLRGTHALYHPRVTLRSLEESMREWLPSGFVRRMDTWRAQGQRRRAHWITEGYVAEREGRQLAKSVTQAAVDELLSYMARNPRVRALIEQQSLGIADEAVGEVRSRAASADTRLEHIAHAILRRTPSSHPPAIADQAPDLSPAAHNTAHNTAHNSSHAEQTT